MYTLKKTPFTLLNFKNFKYFIKCTTYNSQLTFIPLHNIHLFRGVFVCLSFKLTLLTISNWNIGSNSYNIFSTNAIFCSTWNSLGVCRAWLQSPWTHFTNKMIFFFVPFRTYHTDSVDSPNPASPLLICFCFPVGMENEHSNRIKMSSPPYPLAVSSASKKTYERDFLLAVGAVEHVYRTGVSCVLLVVSRGRSLGDPLASFHDIHRMEYIEKRKGSMHQKHYSIYSHVGSLQRPTLHLCLILTTPLYPFFLSELSHSWTVGFPDERRTNIERKHSYNSAASGHHFVCHTFHWIRRSAHPFHPPGTLKFRAHKIRFASPKTPLPKPPTTVAGASVDENVCQQDYRYERRNATSLPVWSVLLMLVRPLS